VRLRRASGDRPLIGYLRGRPDRPHRVRMQGATGTVLPPLTVGRFGCVSNRVACLTPGTQANDLEHARRLGATECSFWCAVDGHAGRLPRRTYRRLGVRSPWPCQEATGLLRIAGASAATSYLTALPFASLDHDTSCFGAPPRRSGRPSPADPQISAVATLRSSCGRGREGSLLYVKPGKIMKVSGTRVICYTASPVGVTHDTSSETAPCRGPEPGRT
jgi:hypothetical protein